MTEEGGRGGCACGGGGREGRGLVTGVLFCRRVSSNGSNGL